jgi:hypothetical protein
MKNNCKLIVALGITVFTHSMYAVAVYLENNYGETVNYKTSSTGPEGQGIGTNVRVLLGDINSLTELWIRTTSMVASYFSSSSYYDLKRLIDEIKSRQLQHSNDDAIIAIDRAGTKQWNPNIRWEAKSKMPFEPLTEAPKVQPTPSQPFTQPGTEIVIDLDQLEKEEALIEAMTADERLNLIKNGALGPDYARKATAICSANYTKAEKDGKINLCSRLKSELVIPKFTIQKKRIAKLASRARAQGAIVRYVHPDLEPAIEDIKASINRIHNALSGYKTRGEAS